jgi:Polyketide cyclase / dehydrase and lipid transport/Uncharacterised protein family (UPF0261)
MGRIFVVGTADTKGEELAYLRAAVAEAGRAPIVVDVGIGPPRCDVDIAQRGRRPSFPLAHFLGSTDRAAYRSAVISAPVQKVWAAIRDFNALPAWHPAIVQSEIERGLASDAIGCVRSFSLQDGGHLREQLLALSDVDHSFTYNILVSPMPVKNYVATFRLTPIRVGKHLRGMVG